jgi:hypothetical protein
MSFVDPIMAAQQQEAMDRLPNIVPMKFWTEYKNMDDGSVRQDDWVLWRKRGTSTGPEVAEKVSKLQKRPDNLVWKVLQPHYDNWKKGEAPPVTGTPLEAWPGIDAGIIKILKSREVFTVEEFCAMADHDVAKLGVPGIRDKQRVAKEYIKNRANAAPYAAEMAQIKEARENDKREIEELRAMIAGLTSQPAAPFTAPVNADVEPKRRGRPPKPKEEVAA